MKTKTLSLLCASIFALILFAGLASATAIFSDNFNDGDLIGWSAVNWTNAETYAASTNLANAVLEKTISTSGYNTIVVKYDRQLGNGWEPDNNFKVSWFNGSSYVTLEEVVGVTGDTPDMPNDAAFVSKTYTLPSTANNNAGLKLKFECSTDAAAEFCRLDNIIIEGTAITTTPTNIPQDITACSATGNLGDYLRIRDVSFDVKEGFGDETEWLPLDEIEVEIEIQNKHNDEKIKDIVVSWGLYNTKTGDWYIDDEENDFDLKDGDDKTLTLTFKLDDDVDELEDGDYKFYVWATGELLDKDICVSDVTDIDIIDESDFVILSNIVSPETSSCGSDVQITADVWNVGSDDQDDVFVIANNKELGILNKKITIGDIDAFDKGEKLVLDFKVPGGIKEMIYYNIEFKVYNEDSEIYENDYDEDQSIFNVMLKVEGNCQVGPTAAISATLESGGKAGEEIVIKATITNTASTTQTYSFQASDYTSWATLTSIEPALLIFNAGESKDVLYKLKVNKDISGSQTFNIEVKSEDNKILKQPVSVSIEKSGFSITGGIISGNNSYLWGIGILNVILVIIIIIVAIKVSRK